MLRRVKKDVEHELAPKEEHDLLCDMSSRQKTLYRLLRAKLPIGEMFKLADSKLKMDNLMNLIMQFRKVCNHPELFERHVGVAPFLCLPPQPPCSLAHLRPPFAGFAASCHAPYLPRLIVHDLHLPELYAGYQPFPHRLPTHLAK